MSLEHCMCGNRAYYISVVSLEMRCNQTWGNRNVISNRLQLTTFFSVIVIDY